MSFVSIEQFYHEYGLDSPNLHAFGLYRAGTPFCVKLSYFTEVFCLFK
jgi:hypothetical protein